MLASGSHYLEQPQPDPSLVAVCMDMIGYFYLNIVEESLKGHISACHTTHFVFTAIVSITWRSYQAKIELELALKQILKSREIWWKFVYFWCPSSPFLNWQTQIGGVRASFLTSVPVLSVIPKCEGWEKGQEWEDLAEWRNWGIPQSFCVIVCCMWSLRRARCPSSVSREHKHSGCLDVVS